MNAHPILMSGDMVRTLLAGTKTQHRCLMKPQPDGRIEVIVPNPVRGWPWWDQLWRSEDGQQAKWLRCPYGSPSDLLWVRETWRIGAWAEDDGSFAVDYKADNFARREWLTDPDDHSGDKFNDEWMKLCQQLADRGVRPGADGRYRWKPGESPLPWRSPVAMPRWASRLTLRITEVRVQRVQEISEGDAMAEGVPFTALPQGQTPDTLHRAQFADLWDSIHGPDSWDANPWVWALTFQVIRKNVDEVLARPVEAEAAP